MGRRTWLGLTLLMAAALAVRLVVLVHLPIPSMVGDAEGYSGTAMSLLTAHTLAYHSSVPNAFTTPGYPIFLAILYGLAGGPATQVVRVVQTVLGALTIWPFFLLARRVAGERAAWITGLFLALYPAWVRAPSYVLTEVLFTFLFGWYLLVQVKALESWQRPKWPLLSGALLALAVLVRPAVALLLLVPWLYQAISLRDRRLWRPLLWAVGAFCVVMAPWWVRNLLTLHHLVLLATQTGNPLLGGMDPYGMWQGRLWAGVGPDPGAQMARAGTIFVWLLTHYPWLTLKWFTVGKFLRIFLHPWLGWELPSLQAVHYPVLALGWLGALALLRRRGPLQFLSLVLCLLTVTQLAFIPESRYAYPLIGLLAINGAVALDRIFVPGGIADAALAGGGTRV